ncbi:MAG TPA: alpha/beta fold hydrolase [Actinomycetota bacterium]|nr:alpha/beta fold hydrolase [Actinomycetota bacterium]
MSGWFAFRRERDDAPIRLFCLPHAGGGALLFRSWHDALPGVDVCPVELPGRGTRLRDAPVEDAVSLALALADEMQPLLDRPYALFGQSMGAVVAFETARTLRRDGAPVPAMFVSASRNCPCLPDARPKVHMLPDDEFTVALRRFGGTPEIVLQDPDMMDLFRPTLRADFAVAETYRYELEAPFECSVCVYSGDGDDLVDDPGLAAWQREFTGRFTQRRFPGGHFFVQKHAADVLRTLSEDLATVTPGGVTRAPSARD